MSKAVEVVLLLDRSGSMASIRQATIEGINKFIADVKAEPGEGYWTLIQFDDMDSARGAGENFPNVVFERIPDEMTPLMEKFDPRGSTALLDAACMTLLRLKERIVPLPKNERPRVMIVIITDGLENASKHYNAARLRELTAEAQSELGWEFIYLGANQDAFAESDKLGINTVLKTCGGIQYLNKVNYAPDAMGFHEGMAKAAGQTRGWKVEGDQTAEQLLSSADPDQKEVR